MSTELIGQRLVQLREELVGLGEKPWTQTRVAQATGLTLNIVLRLEREGAGTISALQALLAFYYERGFNLSWVMLPDNWQVNMRLLIAGAKTVEVSRVQEFAERVRQQLIQLEKDSFA